MVNSANFPQCQCPIKTCTCSGGIHSYIPYYRKILDFLQPQKIFEWGPGQNTILGLKTPSVKSIVAIEQDPQWIPKIEDTRFEVLVIPEHDPQYVHLHGHEDADIFFIDSRRRAECLDLVRMQALPQAVVCLHDAQRYRYHQALAKYNTVKFLDLGFAIATRLPHPNLASLLVEESQW
ncbi:MAG: hypothetical protein V7K86_09555 [Nostoc sp.]|uniref:hypothetical protein n=1 Tax=Nostoc sp. TaxID=1180 RepID=UPI002FFB622E